MKPHVVVAIQDTNQFFALGIKYILQTYFMAKDYTWHFVPTTSEIKIDLMVLAEPSYSPMLVSRLGEQKEDRLLGTIVVRDNTIMGIRSLKPDQVGPSLLGLREEAKVVVHLLEQVFNQACFQPVRAVKKRVCFSVKLTPRERDVLQRICWEQTPSQIAGRLALNVKTVSTHKLTAMRKLGFKRNSELYHWLRHGGLEKGHLE